MIARMSVRLDRREGLFGVDVGLREQRKSEPVVGVSRIEVDRQRQDVGAQIWTAPNQDRIEGVARRRERARKRGLGFIQEIEAFDRHDYAPGAVRTKVLMLTAWAAVNVELSKVRSPPPPVAVTVPCICAVVPS